MSDDELIEEIRNGKTEYGDELVNRYYPSILRYCRWHCASRWQAEDLTQETFYRVFRGLDNYVGQGKFRAYLYRTAYHLCVDEARRTVWEKLPENERDPDNRMEQVEKIETVKRLLAGLTESQREAVILRFAEDMSIREIAGITGIPLRTVQSRIRLALKMLRTEKL